MAAAIADRQDIARRFWVAPGLKLRPSRRRRLHGKRTAPRAHRVVHLGKRRILALLVVALQVGILAELLWSPVFAVHHINISGLQLLDRNSVLKAANLGKGSIFTLNTGETADRIDNLGWVRSATVSTELPDVVNINVVEWPPALRMRQSGGDVLVAPNGATMDATQVNPQIVGNVPLLIDDRPAPLASTVSPELVVFLGQAAANFPAIFGTKIVAERWDENGIFSIWTSAGWQAVLGHIDTDSEISGIPAQLSALASLRSAVNFQSPSFGYVDLENVTEPALGGKPGVDPAVTAELTNAKTPPSRSRSDW